MGEQGLYAGVGYTRENMVTGLLKPGQNRATAWRKIPHYYVCFCASVCVWKIKLSMLLELKLHQ